MKNLLYWIPTAIVIGLYGFCFYSETQSRKIIYYEGALNSYLNGYRQGHSQGYSKACRDLVDTLIHEKYHNKKNIVVTYNDTIRFYFNLK